MLDKLNCYVIRVSILSITVALIIGMVGCGTTSPTVEIRDWYDLDAIRDNLGGSYLLMNDLDSTTVGYEELASPAANAGIGWEPIGTWWMVRMPFMGTFNGQGYEIRDLFINRPDEYYVGLFGYVAAGGVIENVGVVNADVTGYFHVGSLVGFNRGTVSNSYSSGNVAGEEEVGGLVGHHLDGTVSNSYSTGSITSEVLFAGGLVGLNDGTVSNSYSTASVSGNGYVGGLSGASYDTLSESYSSGNVTGKWGVGGLVGWNWGPVSNSYSTGDVSGNSSVGGLVGYFWEGSVSNSYSTGNVTGTYTYYVGGLVGWNEEGTVSNSFWDIETSGQVTSAGGTGKTTADMQDFATFSGAGWDITAVADPATPNPSYIWNIPTTPPDYPFLSWQP